MKKVSLYVFLALMICNIAPPQSSLSECEGNDKNISSFSAGHFNKIRKSNDVQKQQLSILCSLPGVGEKTAIRMLEKFGTPLRVLSSSTTELSKVGGLGEARAKNIKKALQAQSKHLKKTSQKTLRDI